MATRKPAHARQTDRQTGRQTDVAAITCSRRTSVLLAVALSVVGVAVAPSPVSGQPVSTDAVSRYRPNDLFNCTDCNRRILIHKQRKQSRLDQIKLEILGQLGKVDGPMGNVSKVPKEMIKKIMDEHYHKDPDPSFLSDRRGYNNDVSKIYSIPQKVKTIRGKFDILVTFHLNPVQTTGLRIVSTDLMVLVRCGRRRCRPRKVRRGGRRWTPPTITLKIYNMLNSTGDEDGGQLITSLKVGIRRTKWHKLIVPTTVIQEVVDSPSRVLPMRIACENCTKIVRPVAVRKARRKKNKKSRRDVDTVEKTTRQRQKSAARRERRLRKQRAKAGGKARKKKQPYLVIYTRRVDTPSVRVGETMRMGEQRMRQRRHLGDRRDDMTSSPARTCRKKSLYVSFRQLALNNVIAWPVGFLTSYCEDSGASAPPAGRLLHRRHQGNLLEHIKYSRSTASATPEPRCRPTMTSPLSVVYYKDKHNITETSIPGLIVTQCGYVVS